MNRNIRRLLSAKNNGPVDVSIPFLILAICIIAHFFLRDKEVKDTGETDSTKLLVAAKNCDLNTVEYLAKSTIDIHDVSGIGKRALYRAAGKGCLETVKFLVEEGVNINATTIPSVWTALHYAADGNHLEVVKFLLEKGANPNIEADDGRKPRDMVRYSNKFYEEIRSLLYKAEKQYESR